MTFVSQLHGGTSAHTLPVKQEAQGTAAVPRTQKEQAASVARPMVSGVAGANESIVAVATSLRGRPRLRGAESNFSLLPRGREKQNNRMLWELGRKGCCLIPLLFRPSLGLVTQIAHVLPHRNLLICWQTSAECARLSGRSVTQIISRVACRLQAAWKRNMWH